MDLEKVVFFGRSPSALPKYVIDNGIKVQSMQDWIAFPFVVMWALIYKVYLKDLVAI